MPLEPATVHKQHKESGGPRLYGFGGRERGFSFAQYLPNGLPLIPAVVFGLIALVWATPIYSAGIHFKTFSGIGTAILLGPPLGIAWSTRIKLSNNLTISDIFTTYFRFFFMEARRFAGNNLFRPSYIRVRSTVFTPRIDEDTNTTTADTD